MSSPPQTWSAPMPRSIDTDSLDLVATVDLVGRTTVYSKVDQAAAARALRGMADLAGASDEALARLLSDLMKVVVELADLLSPAGPFGSVPAGLLLPVVRHLRAVIDNAVDGPR